MKHGGSLAAAAGAGIPTEKDRDKQQNKDNEKPPHWAGAFRKQDEGWSYAVKRMGLRS
ncbi:hypothetical protein BOO71_0004030 [Deinococcus marmoris]|uniref:Uncharacterized protein n=1 Tax=Deinococcus marmoris TaxID=249408 RepID=A0A1U7P1F6_9DEIO|nr:hypothetical protein BOO71_0004030 [Deinococcus marmoris]